MKDRVIQIWILLCSRRSSLELNGQYLFAFILTQQWQKISCHATSSYAEIWFAGISWWFWLCYKIKWGLKAHKGTSTKGVQATKRAWFQQWWPASPDRHKSSWWKPTSCYGKWCYRKWAINVKGDDCRDSCSGIRFRMAVTITTSPFLCQWEPCKALAYSVRYVDKAVCLLPFRMPTADDNMFHSILHMLFALLFAFTILRHKSLCNSLPKCYMPDSWVSFSFKLSMNAYMYTRYIPLQVQPKIKLKKLKKLREEHGLVKSELTNLLHENETAKILRVQHEKYQQRLQKTKAKRDRLKTQKIDLKNKLQSSRQEEADIKAKLGL